MHHVFCYGTLKSGCRNNFILDGQTLVQEAVSEPFYHLYDNGSYPCLTEGKDGHAVHGEVWQINDVTLKRLDHLEGVPFLYKRGYIKLVGFDKPCIAYFYQQDVSRFHECGESWEPQRQVRA